MQRTRNRIALKCHLNFYHDEKKGVYYYHNVYGKNVTECADSESIGFDGYEQFASHRGFIWSRSLPLLKQNILFGCGPDQFVYEFPNDDYLSLLNNGYYGEIVTKPHNMYLQMGVQTGVVSLIAFILFYILYCIQSIKLLWKTKDISVSYIISEAVLIGSFGYMVTGIANDSTIGVAPVFWTFIGVRISCPFMLYK